MGRHGYTPQKTIQQRRAEILELVMKGITSNQIVAHISEEYNITEPTVRKDITLAYSRIQKEYDIDSNDLIKKHLALYDQIIADSNETLDHSSKIKAMQAKEKLLKLHVPEHLVQIHNSKQELNINLNDLSVDELKKILND